MAPGGLLRLKEVEKNRAFSAFSFGLTAQNTWQRVYFIERCLVRPRMYTELGCGGCTCCDRTGDVPPILRKS